MVDFKTISIRGRIAYGIMCAENYALSKYPDRDWKPLFQVLWGISRDDVYWDEWASDVIDRLSETVFFDDPRDWEETEPEVLERCRALYQGMPEAFNGILSGIVDIEEADAYELSGDGLRAVSCRLGPGSVTADPGTVTAAAAASAADGAHKPRKRTTPKR